MTSSLDARDQQLLASSVLELHSLPFGPSFLEDMLRVVRRLLGADSAIYALSDVENELPVTVAAVPNALDFERWSGVFETHFADYPLNRRHDEIAALQVVLLSEHGGPGWAKSALHRKLRDALGLENQLLLRTPTSPGYLEVIGGARTGSDFTAREVALLEGFKEHLALAWAKAQLLARSRDPVGTEALSPWRTETIVIDGQGRVMTGSPRGRKLLSSYFDASAPAKRLPAPIKRWLGEQLARPAGARAGDAGQRLSVPRNGRRLDLWLVPRAENGRYDLHLRERPHDWQESAPPADPNPATDARMERAAKSWGLTARQRQVLSVVIAGNTNKEIAAALGCAEVTAEFHISALLRKAAVASRTALVSKYWAM